MNAPDSSTPQAAPPGRFRIFLNYRRDDTADAAGRLYDALSAHFGEEHVFMDIDKIEPGLDFGEVIQEAVDSCDVLIAVIGRTWLNATDAHGERRVDDADDFVRMEVQTALERGVRVLPVLVQGAQMPNPDDLPESLKPLGRRNALEISHARWSYDVGRLTEALERVAQQVGATAAPAPAGPAPEQAARPSTNQTPRKESAPAARSGTFADALRRRWPMVAAAAAALVAAAVIVVVAGGSGSGSNDEINSVVKSYFTAVANGDGGTVCNLMSGDARHRFMAKVPNVTECTVAVTAVQTQLSGAQIDRLRKAKVVEVKTHGSTATATVEGAGRTALVQLRKEAGKWKVNSLPGG